MVKVITISMVKNEADVIESFVRHTLSFADEMLIAEHSSTDKTMEILRKLQEEGLPITVRRIYTAGFVQFETMNTLLHEAAVDKEADIVLPLDADEFLVNTVTEEPLRDIVRKLDSNKMYRLRMRVCEPAEPYKDEDCFMLSRTLRCGTGYAQGQKVIIGGALYRKHPFQLAQGNHYCFWISEAGEEKVAWSNLEHIYLAHFLWRSNEQYLCKIRTLRLNSVANYSLHTPTALLMSRYQKIAAGNGEGCTFEGPYEIVDFNGAVTPQTLRYSKNVRPDPEQRLFEVGIQIAAAHAEARVLARHRIVTSVVPYNGDAAALRASLQTIYEQLYPYKEVFVLSFCKPDDRSWSIINEFNALPPYGDSSVVCPEKMKVTLISAENGNIFTCLSDKASGDYVQWLLLGDTLAPDKLTRMVASIEFADYPFAFIFTNGEEKFENWLPWGNLPADREFLMADRIEIWKYCLKQGKYPASGLAGALFRREIMESRNWLEGGFLDGRPLQLTIWRMLCTPTRGDGALNQAAVIQKMYSTSPRKNINIVDWVWHQIEWYCLLDEDRPLIGKEESERSLKWLKENAAVVSDHEGVPAALWEQYQEILWKNQITKSKNING